MMTERIQQLIYSLNEKVGVHWTNEDKLKFAELMIRECGYYADVFEAVGCPVDMDPTETKPSDYIKKQLGIENE